MTLKACSITRTGHGKSVRRDCPDCAPTAAALHPGQRAKGLRLLTCAALAVALAVPGTAGAQAPAPSDQRMTLTLLGTGTPLALLRRFGSSAIVQAGDQLLMFDVGRGATIRLAQVGIPAGKVDAVFLTHFHSDHTVGLPDLFATGYISVPSIGGRKGALEVYGPEGTSALVDGIVSGYRADAEIRHEDEGNPYETMEMKAHEIAPGVVYEKDGVTVTAFPVDHGDHIKPALGYKIEYAGHKIVLSGDTRYSPEVVANGKDADLLVHETFFVPEELENDPIVARIMAHHTAPENVGRVFEETRPKMAVYTHAGRLPGPNGAPTTADLLERTRETYSGPLIMGEDLMRFIVDDKGVAVYMSQPE